MSAPTLAEVAGWEVPLLRGAVWTLDSVAGGLPAWRARVEAVGRSLEDASCWYGPAAQSAAAALVEVSTIVTAVTAALDESLEHAQRLLVEAEAAQELAERALAAAASVPVVLDGAGRLAGSLPFDPVTGLAVEDTSAALRAEELAIEAVTAGQRAALAAGEAAGSLAGLGIGAALAPVSFGDLSWLVAGDPSGRSVPCPPTGGDAAAVAAWWAGLSTAERVAAIDGRPALIGGLEGLPAWARDHANRLVLGEVLADPSVPGHAMAGAVAAEISREESDGKQVQLLQFAPADELVALGLGDLDTADSIALLVPGMTNTPDSDLDELADNADAVAAAARAAAPGLAVAAVAWFGYRPPMGIGALGTSISRAGGRALDNALDGLSAVRAADPARVVAIGHSYGTRVVDAAADAPGRMAAAAVVLNGSPGMDNDAEDLEVAEVYEASSPADPISWWDAHGEYPTWDDDFGAIELPTGPVMMHWEYYSEYFPTLAAVGEVVAGVREPA